jgi:purine-binding chemotaxis protein CheW
MQYLNFLLGDETYGIDVTNIKEVIEYENVYSVPLVSNNIKGIMNLRGEVVPVVDLTHLFYNKSADKTKLSCIVIIEKPYDNEIITIGVMIDAIQAVINLTEDEIEDTPGFGSKISHDYISGVGKLDEKFIILLDINKVLDVDDLSNFEEK